MTIYECLGIDQVLLDMMIPKENIVENLPTGEMRRAAAMEFAVIDKITLRASLQRNRHYLQVIEIELLKPENIEQISFLIQKAVKYRVLFVFVFQERYLLLWRNFIATARTENVSTAHINKCTNWIYKESLNANLLCFYQDVAIVKDINALECDREAERLRSSVDNGDTAYFSDVLHNVNALNDCMVDGEFISARYLIDWLQTHAPGQRMSIEDFLEPAYENDAYQVFDGHLFFEKSRISLYIGELDNATYLRSLDHTGKYPTEYFTTAIEIATYADEEKLMAELFATKYEAELYEDNTWVDEDA